MNKKILFILSLGFFGGISAQNTAKLQNQLAKSQKAKEQKFNKYLQKNGSKYTKEEIADMKSRLAGFAGEIPVFNQIDDNRANMSANVIPIQSGSLNGLSNMPIDGTGLNILVMDGGKIFEKHIEFGASKQGVVTTPRIFDRENGLTSYGGHPTNVGGIIGAMGVGNFAAPYGAGGAKGVLTKVNLDSYSFETTANGNNYQKLAAALGANISNHSYGINLGWTYKTTPTPGYYWIGNYDLNTEDTYSGSYFTQDANFDKIVYNNPNQIIIKSAGNYYGLGPDGVKPNFKFDEQTGDYVPFLPTDVLPAANCSKGYNCIGWGSLAKNIIVVGATEQLTTVGYKYTQPTDVVRSSYSSAGPRKDGAIKPDISAVGSNHVIANFTNETTYDDYLLGSGTSYSAPVISGIAGALTQITRKLTSAPTFIYRADEMKALLLHTANEAGRPGPDVEYGWGFADASKAVRVIIDKIAGDATFQKNTLTKGVNYTQEVFGKAGEPLKATISWIDPEGTPFTSDNDLQNNHTSMLVNDLDLRIIDTTDNTIYYPWKLDINNPVANANKGDNTVDNVEQVIVDAPVAGRKYKIVVSNKGSLFGENGIVTQQDYAIVVTGYNNTNLAVTDSKLESISVYPTKTKDFVNVLIPIKAQTITIFDMTGKTISTQAAKASQEINFSQLPNGVYLINIKTNNGTITKKIIKE